MSSKEVPKFQVPINLPPPSFLLVTSIVQEAEEGEMVPPKGAKQPKNSKDRQASSVDNKEDPIRAEVHR